MYKTQTSLHHLVRSDKMFCLRLPEAFSDSAEREAKERVKDITTESIRSMVIETLNHRNVYYKDEPGIIDLKSVPREYVKPVLLTVGDWYCNYEHRNAASKIMKERIKIGLKNLQDSIDVEDTVVYHLSEMEMIYERKVLGMYLTILIYSSK